jgi:hypothetical protein
MRLGRQHYIEKQLKKPAVAQRVMKLKQQIPSRFHDILLPHMIESTILDSNGKQKPVKNVNNVINTALESRITACKIAAALGLPGETGKSRFGRDQIAIIHALMMHEIQPNSFKAPSREEVHLVFNKKKPGSKKTLEYLLSNPQNMEQLLNQNRKLLETTVRILYDVPDIIKFELLPHIILSGGKLKTLDDVINQAVRSRISFNRLEHLLKPHGQGSNPIGPITKQMKNSLKEMVKKEISKTRSNNLWEQVMRGNIQL